MNDPQATRSQAPKAIDPAAPTIPPRAEGPVQTASYDGASAAHSVSSSAPPGYELLGVLGEGGMGIVYKARQSALNRIVALKMIRFGGHATAEARTRFLAEANAVAALNHAGIVQIYECGTFEGLPYFAFEYCEGGNLAARIRETPLPVREAAEVIEKLARAVQAAHERGIIHRDLKPANVLIAANGALKVTDFGLAKQIESDSGLTQSGAIVGTPSYMAPEQAGGRKREITRAADVYSLGAILYELLTGRPPFRADTVLDTLLLLVSEEVTPPSELCKNLPRDLEAICLKCLEKMPGKRYEDAGSLADDLRRFLNGEPVKARSGTMAEQAWRWARNRPITAAVLTFTAGLALTSAFLVTYVAPSILLYWGWVVWPVAATTLCFRSPDRRGLAVAASGFLLFGYFGWQTTVAPGLGRLHEYTGSLLSPYLHILIWIETTTAIVFLFPGRGGLAWAGLFSLVLGLSFFGTVWPDRYYVPFLPSPIGAAACCAVARLLTYTVSGSFLAAVLAGFWSGVVGYVFSFWWLMPTGDVMSPGSLSWSNSGKLEFVQKAATIQNAAAIISLLICACAAFLAAQLTSSRPEIRQWWSRGIRRILRPLADVRSRFWVGIAAAPLAACLVLVLGRGVWLWATSRELLTLTVLPSLTGHTNAVFSVAFSPDGGRFAAVGERGWNPNLERRPDNVVICDAKTGKKLHGYNLEGSPYCVAFDPNGAQLAVATQFADLNTQMAQVIVLDVSQDRVVLRPNGLSMFQGQKQNLRGIDYRSRCVAYSADGNRLAAGDTSGSVKVWNGQTGEELLALPKQLHPVNWVAFSPDSKRLATFTNGARVWDVRTGKLITALPQTLGADVINPNLIYTGAFSPDGMRLAATGGQDYDYSVRVWDLATVKELFSLPHTGGTVASVAFSPNGRWLASAGNDRNVWVWNAASGHELVKLQGHSNTVNSVAFSPDSRRLASASSDGTVRIWRIAD